MHFIFYLFFIIQMFTEQGLQRVYGDYSRINNTDKCITDVQSDLTHHSFWSSIQYSSGYLNPESFCVSPNQAQLVQLRDRDSEELTWVCETKDQG